MKSNQIKKKSKKKSRKKKKKKKKNKMMMMMMMMKIWGMDWWRCFLSSGPEEASAVRSGDLSSTLQGHFR